MHYYSNYWIQISRYRRNKFAFEKKERYFVVFIDYTCFNKSILFLFFRIGGTISAKKSIKSVQTTTTPAIRSWTSEGKPSNNLEKNSLEKKLSQLLSAQAPTHIFRLVRPLQPTGKKILSMTKFPNEWK